uniref:Uncharacterized protein n=1 Tax=Yersinia enterocolitica W22703 TaxID=913028 RepID=F4MY73_YEREN|nr:unknown protein [Yersinia enterocolitica W22703]
MVIKITLSFNVILITINPANKIQSSDIVVFFIFNQNQPD